MNVAPSAAKAKDIVFTEIHNRIQYSPWFQTYYPPDPKIKSMLRFDFQAEGPDGKLVGKWDGQKNIAIIPGNSARNMAIGYNVLAAVIDEAAFFETLENIGRASTERTDDIYDALQRRIFSRFWVGRDVGYDFQPAVRRRLHGAKISRGWAQPPDLCQQV